MDESAQSQKINRKKINVCVRSGPTLPRKNKERGLCSTIIFIYQHVQRQKNHHVQPLSGLQVWG